MENICDLLEEFSIGFHVFTSITFITEVLQVGYFYFSWKISFYQMFSIWGLRSFHEGTFLRCELDLSFKTWKSFIWQEGSVKTCICLFHFRSACLFILIYLTNLAATAQLFTQFDSIHNAVVSITCFLLLFFYFQKFGYEKENYLGHFIMNVTLLFFH